MNTQVTINIVGGIDYKKVIFMSKTTNEKEALEDIMQRYTDIVNDVCKSGKDIVEKKRMIRQKIDKTLSYGQETEDTRKIQRIIQQKFLSSFQHSRGWELYGIEIWDNKKAKHIDISPDYLNIIDKDDHWKNISEVQERQNAVKKYNDVVSKLKDRDKRIWAILASIKTIERWNKDDPICLGGINSYSKDAPQYVIYLSNDFIYLKNSDIEQKLINIANTILNDRKTSLVKNEAKELYKKTFGKNW